MPPLDLGTLCTQFAALPWRKVRGEIQILLVTTRNTRRWIVPKGWPMIACSPAESAAHEALEEAGVTGQIANKRCGSFSYQKLLKSGKSVTCTVDVYALKVRGRRRTWPEKEARETRWCSLEEAMEYINEPSLRRVIVRFMKTFRAR